MKTELIRLSGELSRLIEGGAKKSLKADLSKLIEFMPGKPDFNATWEEWASWTLAQRILLISRTPEYMSDETSIFDEIIQMQVADSFVFSTQCLLNISEFHWHKNLFNALEAENGQLASKEIDRIVKGENCEIRRDLLLFFGDSLTPYLSNLGMNSKAWLIPQRRIMECLKGNKYLLFGFRLNLVESSLKSVIVFDDSQG